RLQTCALGRPRVSACLRPCVLAGLGFSSLGVPVGGEEGDEALVLLGARRAALEVGGHAGNGGVGVVSRHLELHVAVELLEALVAAELRALGAQQAADHVRTPAHAAASS